MKILSALLFIFFFNYVLKAQSIAINIDGSVPNASAMLDVKSTTKGMLIPRMTSAQRTAIAAPAKGLLVFDNDNNSFWFYDGAAWANLSAGSGSSVGWSASDTNIYNSNSGNVGIGTSTPINKLTIQTPINSAGWTHIGGADSIILSERVGGVSAVIGTSTNHVFRLSAYAEGRVSIFPTGEVVVGANTVAPYGKFTVKTLNNSVGISHLGEGGNILATLMGGTSAGIGTFSPTNMRIFANGYSAIFVSAANGFIGIGTDNPTYRLSVNGNIRSKEVVVETNWADYVFDKKYKLRPLDDVERFIQQNNHLPNIPSAKEIENNGLHIGEVQKKMMEKIEELTLYVIELKKEIDALKNK